MKQSNSLWHRCSGLLLLLGMVVFTGSAAASDYSYSSRFDINTASWSSYRDSLTVDGNCDRYRTVTVNNADTNAPVATDDSCRYGNWQITKSYSSPSAVPCRVKAVQSDGKSVIKDVDHAPSNCDDGGGTPPGGGGGSGFQDQTDFKILMNYELGMHCTGFEFAYCCVLPVYNSILAQVVKPEGTDGSDFPELLEGDPDINTLDGLGRQTVLRDKALDRNDNFKKYVLKYWHDAQPRNDGRGAPQGFDRLISAVEGNSLMAWNTTFDSAWLDSDGKYRLSGGPDPDDPDCVDPSDPNCDRLPLYQGAKGVVLGDGDFTDATDNYQNGVWNHLYFYADLEGSNPNDTSAESEKIRLGVSGHPRKDKFENVAFPTDCGPAFHPMGPVTQNGDPDNPVVANDCGGFSNGNVLTYSGEHGTVVFTQMKLLENLPIMLTSPDIWEALGLPLTPFEDSIDFFGDPGLVDEDSIRPYVAMKAQMYHYDGGSNNSPVLDRSGNPVIGFGTAPIDIPNCERCHSNDSTAVNSPNLDPTQEMMVAQEYNFWNAYYDIVPVSAGGTDSDWYSRLKSAAISMLKGHDLQHGTDFTGNYAGVECTHNPDPFDPAKPLDPPSDPESYDCSHVNGLGDLTNQTSLPQNTRLGNESVICQKCHADNVIAVVKSATHGGKLIPPVTEAIHINHKGISEVVDNDADGRDDVDGAIGIAFNDSQGRTGGCQGCHPAHRSSGDMSRYPITLAGTNEYKDDDNRDANGGCFVGRDVHSNPGKDVDGAETPSHLNPVGQWLVDNVYRDGASLPDDAGKGLWCTNCHQQFGQELWKAENVADLVNAQPGDAGHVRQPVDLVQDPSGVGGTLADVAAAVGVTEEQAIAWLDPNSKDLHGTGLGDFTHTIWKADPGLCKFLTDPGDPAHDGKVATVEVSIGGNTCSAPDEVGPIDCSADGGPIFTICGTKDGDGDFSVNLVPWGYDSNHAVCTPDPTDPNDDCKQESPFCTTTDCVAAAQTTLGPCSLLPGERCAVAVPFSAATDGRDHWLSAGEPHCADCHAAPYVEQSGNINAFPPFNYPRKASLMRYSRGHQDISCQGCHESIHGLYPVTPDIDTTTYAQAASLNADGSHGPLKCGTCHDVGSDGIPTWVDDLRYNGTKIRSVPTADQNGTPLRLDAAISWMHTYTEEANPVNDVCLNCHSDEADEVCESSWDGSCNWNDEWLEHADKGRVSRGAMDKTEQELVGHVAGDADPDGNGVTIWDDPSEPGENPLRTVCRGCHEDESDEVSCRETEWKEHLAEGRVAVKVWEQVSTRLAGSTCGW